MSHVIVGQARKYEPSVNTRTSLVLLCHLLRGTLGNYIAVLPSVNFSFHDAASATCRLEARHHVRKARESSHRSRGTQDLNIVSDKSQHIDMPKRTNLRATVELEFLSPRC